MGETVTPDSAEEGMRQLQAALEGVPTELEVKFLGHSYPVSGKLPLIAILRYAATGSGTPAQRAEAETLGDDGKYSHPSDQAMMAATYQFLSECMTHEVFGSFQEAAIRGKVSVEEITDTLSQAISALAARPWRAALRLLRVAALDFAQVDGELLLAGGPGLVGLSIRQVCNVIFAREYARIDEDHRAEWVEELYLDRDPEGDALAMVRQMQRDRKLREAEERADDN
jgi:hypothetical protein